MSEASRLVVGIDLGTTHCAMTYAEGGKVRPFPILQKGEEGEERPLPLLPSCLYLADQEEDDHVGLWARLCGLRRPTRLIHSAKSWLAHSSAHRQEAILPYEAIDEGRRLSPVAVTARLLNHMKHAWNHKKNNLEDLETIITIPASFDEVARGLTLQAARDAALLNVTLLEEPLAAMYAWLHAHPKCPLKIGSQVLVCDVGGGTTDFSLLSVTEKGLERLAVGPHLLLGGDNMDLFLAHQVQARIDQELTANQWLSLILQVRAGKEKLPSDLSIFIAGEGSTLVGNSFHLTLSGEQMLHGMLEGFFPLLSWEEAQRLQKGSGIRQMGLPFESDPAITKHLASFLSGCQGKPRYVLFNGGVFHPPLFRQRVIDSLTRWFGTVEVLESSSLDLAVSKGAAIFGMGELKIGSGLPRSFYLGVALPGGEEERGLTVLARGAEVGESYIPDHRFSLRTNQPAQFSLYHSHTRLGDRPGEIVSIDQEQLSLLPPIQTQLKYGSQTEVEVNLRAELTPIGTVSLSLMTLDRTHQWQLEFGLKNEGAPRHEEILEKKTIEQISHTIREGFAVGTTHSLIPLLEEALGQKKMEWSCAHLRAMSDPLIQLAHKRHLATHYGTRFWNLIGFSLRPGIGHPLDPHRMKEVWKIILEDRQMKQGHEVALQQWICYRRIAAGLTKGQQENLFHAVSREKTRDRNTYAEKIRALAAFERVDGETKTKLGKGLLKGLEEGGKEPCDYWALARLGARRLLYGSVADVLPRAQIESWVERLLKLVDVDQTHYRFLLATLATPIGNRALDLSEKTRKRVEEAIGEIKIEWESSDLDRLFGDRLPPGLVFQGPM